MEINPIGESHNLYSPEMSGLNRGDRGCVFYKEERCCAPRLRFDKCHTCYRIHPKHAARYMMHKVKQLADKWFNVGGVMPGGEAGGAGPGAAGGGGG